MAQIITPDLAVNPVNNISKEETAFQLDLIPSELKAPIYKQRRFNQVSGTSTLAVTTSNVNSVFNIPGDVVWNFSRGFITLDMVATPANNSYATMFTDCLPIDSIQLQTNSGEIIALVQEAQIYTKVAQHMATNMDDYLSNGPVYGENTALGTAYPLSQITGCNPSVEPLLTNALGITTTAAGFAFVATARSSITAAAPGVITSNLLSPGLPSSVSMRTIVATTQADTLPSAFPATQASGTDVLFRAPQRLSTSAAVTTVGAWRYYIPLRAFVGTILAVDKDLYFGQGLQLQINWKPMVNWGFSSLATGLTDATLTGAVTNYYLYMYQDVNRSVHEELQNIVSTQGMQVLVPYTTTNQLSTTATTTGFTMSIPLTAGSGLGLKRIITVPTLNNTDVAKLTANTFNANGVKWSNVQSTLDGRPLQDQQLLMSDSTCWNYMKSLIKRSPSGLSQRTWEENCFFLDNFSDCDDSTNFYKNDCMKSGLEIKQARTYAINITQASTTTYGLRVLSYQTYVRPMLISRSGVNWASVL